jgi:hypothetical protein
MANLFYKDSLLVLFPSVNSMNVGINIEVGAGVGVGVGEIGVTDCITSMIQETKSIQNR